MTVTEIPTNSELEAHLESLFRTGVRVASRQLLETGTYPKEVVTIRAEASSVPSLLFVKYEAGLECADEDHRRGVAYEARVYRDVLQPAGLGADVFLGSIKATNDHVWLVLEFLEDGQRVMKVPAGRAMVEAANWSGLLHRAFELRDPHAVTFPWMTCYDASHFGSLATRARATLSRESREHAVIDCLIADFVAYGLEHLVRAPTLLHGEFYPKNILWAREQVVPVDWETAAFGAGEFDLAMLIEGWPVDIADHCIARYASARWPDGVPPEFSDRLDWARVAMYLHRISEEMAPDEESMSQLVGLAKRLADGRERACR